MTVQINVKPETAVKLEHIARTLGLSVDAWLDRISTSFIQPANDYLENSQETIGQRLERKGLLGIIDSSLLPDPESPPRRDALFDMIADKLKKQGITAS